MALLLVSIPGEVEARTYHVRQDGKGDAVTIQAAVNRARPGDTVVVHGGVYRESVEVRVSGRVQAPIVIQGAAGEQVVISGADLVRPDKWKRIDGSAVWRYAPWTHSAPTRTIRGKTYISEQVIVDGNLLRRAPTFERMYRGTFFADPVERRALFVWTADSGSPAGRSVQVSVRPALMVMTGSHLIVRHFVFRYGSNNGQQPVLRTAGEHNLVEDCTVERTGGTGATIEGRYNTFRRVISRYNGQIGMKGFGSDNLIEECQLIGNNVSGFPRGWEAGGIKIARTRRFRVVRCIATGNDGKGFWFDIDNRDGVIERSYAGENNGPGIFVEISQGITVRNNLCVRNGLKKARGRWAHAGILLGESKRCTVEHNVCVGNRVGIEVRQQRIRMIKTDPSRERSKREIYFSDKLVFRGNIAAFNRQWQFALVGDNPFFGKREKEAVPTTQQMLLLDPDLRGWVSERNLYYGGKRKRGRKMIVWGAPWRPRREVYLNIDSLVRRHRVEQGSIIADPLFVDWKAGDFRLRPESPARRIGAGFTQQPVQPARGQVRTDGMAPGSETN